MNTWNTIWLHRTYTCRIYGCQNVPLRINWVSLTEHHSSITRQSFVTVNGTQKLRNIFSCSSILERVPRRIYNFLFTLPKWCINSTVLAFISESTLNYKQFSLRVLSLSFVSIIPPLLHTRSFIYHPRCIMFFSQYFSFPLSVSFHHCFILIHSSTTHAV